jgi:propionate CoA-transferase
VEAYAWPIGATMHWLRDVGRRGPGYLTEVGLGTFIDPRQVGGRLNDRTTEQLVRIHEIDQKEYLFYPTWDLNIGLIRASAADEAGNLCFDEEPLHSAALAIALAVRACGGKVIAQVKRVVERGSLPAEQMRVPGALVDHIVIDTTAKMTTDVDFDGRYLQGVFSSDGLQPVPFGPEKVIARRAAREVREGEVSIFGFGASADIPLIMVEDGLFDDGGVHRYTQTTEHGSFGGIVMSGWQFSANLFPEALIDGVYQFDFINGGNCDFAALAFAQFDVQGNVNVSKFAGYNPGSGGYIDIASNTQRLVLTGTFTTGGLDVESTGGGLRIVTEGRFRKFVNSVEQITYPLMSGIRKSGQTALIITERAVFGVDENGLTLEEIADGVDLQRDILDQMEYPPFRIAEPLKKMDPALFKV